MAGGLRRINNSRSHSDKASSYRFRLEQIKFINDNKKYLERAGEDRKLRLVNSIKEYYEQNKFMTGPQLSAVDDVYERVMLLAGFGGYKGIKTKYGVKL